MISPVRHLQLSVGTLQLPAPPTFLTHDTAETHPLTLFVYSVRR